MISLLTFSTENKTLPQDHRIYDSLFMLQVVSNIHMDSSPYPEFDSNIFSSEQLTGPKITHYVKQVTSHTLVPVIT